MAPRRSKGVPSDRHLQKLWREAVLLEWGGKCVLESMACQGTLLECHHIKKRRVPHLRHVTPNGVPLCRYHHRQAEYRETRQRIEYLVGESTMEWLDTMERKLFPAFLSETNQTSKEYMIAREEALKELIRIWRSAT